MGTISFTFAESRFKSQREAALTSNRHIKARNSGHNQNKMGSTSNGTVSWKFDENTERVMTTNFDKNYKEPQLWPKNVLSWPKYTMLPTSHYDDNYIMKIG